MKLVASALPDVLCVEPAHFDDARGWLAVAFDQAAFHAGLQALGRPLPPPFVQDNQSMSHAGVLRGLHYQLPPHAQGKLVRVLRGAAFDVAVDIRRGSPTFGRWVGHALSAANARQVWIPEGFAHGFLALEEGTEFLYKVTAPYAPSLARTLAWNDPALGIAWPAWPGGPRLAERDRVAPGLGGAEVFASAG